MSHERETERRTLQGSDVASDHDHVELIETELAYVAGGTDGPPTGAGDDNGVHRL